MSSENTRRLGIETLPSEIILQIIQACTTRSVFNLYLTCHRLKELVDAQPWRKLCEREFRYWGTEHDINRLQKQHPKSDPIWQHLFKERWKKQEETTKTLDSILQSQSGRIDKYQKIVDLGYDAKDCLLKHLSVDEYSEDGLARRWYADAVLGCLHRSMAINEWYSAQAQLEQDLERSLAAFDMFVLHERQGDFNETQSRLDSVAAAIAAEDSDFHSRNVRQKALAIATYLRRNELVGLRGRADLEYRDLQNNFIGFALHDPRHASLPLISAAIYSGVARRLGVKASPCALPFHVFVIVQPPDDITLDGKQWTEDTEGYPDMFLDPFESSNEVPKSILTDRLNSVGTPSSMHGSYLQPAPVTDLVLRTGRNILTSVQEHHRGLGHTMFATTQTSSSSIFTDLEGSFYGALWSALLFARPPNGDGPIIATLNRRAYLPAFVDHFETHFPMDAALLERHIIPMFQSSPECDQLKESVRVMRSVDLMPKTSKARTKEISERVRFKVGQVFRHRRYNYIAVITGWDIECGAGEQWMARMRVHELSKGGDQSFYHVLVEDQSIRYVAQENIDIITPEEPRSLMALAGRHFKRWDRSVRRFISNIKDEYPDD